MTDNFRSGLSLGAFCVSRTCRYGNMPYGMEFATQYGNLLYRLKAEWQ